MLHYVLHYVDRIIDEIRIVNYSNDYKSDKCYLDWITFVIISIIKKLYTDYIFEVSLELIIFIFHW